MSDADKTAKKVGVPFKDGAEWNGNRAGRPKGSKNKLGEDFISALQADFEANGVAAIATVREERPHEYLKVIAGILPKELNVTTTTIEGLSDDDLARGIAALQSALASGAATTGSEPETKH
jgi:hypothetical protein